MLNTTIAGYLFLSKLNYQYETFFLLTRNSVELFCGNQICWRIAMSQEQPVTSDLDTIKTILILY
jgi:hypothetical protein